MKSRLKQIITSTIGVLIMLSASIMYFFNDLVVEEFDMSLIEYLSVMFLGYVFLVAKDSLIQGIFLNLLKIKDKK